MSKYIPGNQKHLTLEDRKYIEKSLNAGCSFKDIARYLCKDPTTISKEIRLHRLSDWYHKGCFNNAHNFCVHRYHCKKVNACGKIILCGVKCTTCPTCNQTCPDFVKERCNRLDKAPYVCNGCPKAINHCTIAHKYRYDAIFADRKYKECLSQSRGRYKHDQTRTASERYGHHAPDFSEPVSISDYNESSRTRYVRENSMFLP